MSYPTMPPPAMTPAAAPASPAGRPPVVSVAAVLLWVMAVVGLIYAIATIAVVPGTVSRFRAAIDGTTSSIERFNGGTDPDTYVAVVWLGAAVGLAIGVILFALYVVLGIALRRGSNAARITALVCCGLGALAGAGALIAVASERAGEGSPWSVGEQLSRAYPSGWLGVNVTLAGAQIIAYGLVAILILTAPRVFFGRAESPEAALSGLPRYGSTYPPAPGYGPAPGYPPLSGYPQPAPAPGYGPTPVFGQPGAPDPSAFGPPPALGGYPPVSAPPTASGPPAQGFAGPASAPPAPGVGPYPPAPGPGPYPPAAGAGPYPPAPYPPAAGAGPYPLAPGTVPYLPAPGTVPYPPAPPAGQPTAAGPWAMPPAYGYYGPPTAPPGDYGSAAHGPGYPVVPPGHEAPSDWARPTPNPEQATEPASPQQAATPAPIDDSAGPAAVSPAAVSPAAVIPATVSPATASPTSESTAASEGDAVTTQSSPAADQSGSVASKSESSTAESVPPTSESKPGAAESGPASETFGDSKAPQPADESPFARPAGLGDDRSFAPTGDTGPGEPSNQTPASARPAAAVDDDFWARPTE